MSRAAAIAGFIAAAGWAEAAVEPMEADFSPRRYARLRRDDGSTAILMDADPDQKTPQFVMIARQLHDIGLSAPEIIANHAPQGLVLMEDFGAGNVGRLIDGGTPVLPFALRAAEVLGWLHRHVRDSPPPPRGEGLGEGGVTPGTVFQNPEQRAQPSPPLPNPPHKGEGTPVHMYHQLSSILKDSLPHFTPALFAEQAELFVTHYLPFALDREAAEAEREAFREAWLQTLEPIEHLPQSLILRDFMPDNVMDLPERSGVCSLGLLDFQDAGIGCIAYDIASFCEVVRRDGGDALLSPMIAHYIDQASPACSAEELTNACILLSAQRHTRILGILAKNPNKRAYIPRVQKHIAQLMQADALRPVAAWMKAAKLFA